MSLEPPPFQESSRCDVCKCSFNTFRRRHHCRCCGRTLCAEHSSDQMALPQFGLHSLVRVCSDCYNNNASRSGKSDGAGSVNGVTDSFSRLDISTPSNSNSNSNSNSTQSAAVDCTCGMPLCICECEVPSNDDVQPKPFPTCTIPSTSKTKKADPTPRSRASSSSKSSTGQSSNTDSEKPLANYQVNGEALREAIKDGDLFSVRKLLGEGVDANYCDKQGLSLLHLAAVFNQTEIAFTLMEHGASPDYNNLQGETPLDCAPVTLQFKMKKMEEIQQSKFHSLQKNPTNCEGQAETGNQMHNEQDKTGADATQSTCLENNNNNNNVEYEPAKPVLDPVWRGSFDITEKEDYNVVFEGLLGHISNKACYKACQEANVLPSLLSLEMHPKSVLWPKTFLESQPSDKNIALYFFPGDPKNERDYEELVSDMIDEDLAMKVPATNAELLIFTSTVLPRPFWRFQGKNYLWGVFRGKKKKDVAVSNSKNPENFPTLSQVTSGKEILPHKTENL